MARVVIPSVSEYVQSATRSQQQIDPRRGAPAPANLGEQIKTALDYADKIANNPMVVMGVDAARKKIGSINDGNYEVIGGSMADQGPATPEQKQAAAASRARLGAQAAPQVQAPAQAAPQTKVAPQGAPAPAAPQAQVPVGPTAEQMRESSLGRAAVADAKDMVYVGKLAALSEALSQADSLPEIEAIRQQMAKLRAQRAGVPQAPAQGQVPSPNSKANDIGMQRFNTMQLGLPNNMAPGPAQPAAPQPGGPMSARVPGGTATWNSEDYEGLEDLTKATDAYLQDLARGLAAQRRQGRADPAVEAALTAELQRRAAVSPAQPVPPLQNAQVAPTPAAVPVRAPAIAPAGQARGPAPQQAMPADAVAPVQALAPGLGQTYGEGMPAPTLYPTDTGKQYTWQTTDRYGEPAAGGQFQGAGSTTTAPAQQPDLPPPAGPSDGPPVQEEAKAIVTGEAEAERQQDVAQSQPIELHTPSAILLAAANARTPQERRLVALAAEYVDLPATNIFEALGIVPVASRAAFAQQVVKAFPDTAAIEARAALAEQTAGYKAIEHKARMEQQKAESEARIRLQEKKTETASAGKKTPEQLAAEIAKTKAETAALLVRAKAATLQAYAAGRHARAHLMDVQDKSPREQKKALIKGGEMDVKAADKTVERLRRDEAAAKEDFDKNAPLPEPKRVARAGDVYTQDDAAKERDRQGDKREAASREKANAVRAVARAAAKARMDDAAKLRGNAEADAATARSKLEAARNWAPPAGGATPVTPPIPRNPGEPAIPRNPGESDRDWNARILRGGK